MPLVRVWDIDVFQKLNNLRSKIYTVIKKESRQLHEKQLHVFAVCSYVEGAALFGFLTKLLATLMRTDSSL